MTIQVQRNPGPVGEGLLVSPDATDWDVGADTIAEMYDVTDAIADAISYESLYRQTDVTNLQTNIDILQNDLQTDINNESAQRQAQINFLTSITNELDKRIKNLLNGSPVDPSKDNGYRIYLKDFFEMLSSDQIDGLAQNLGLLDNKIGEKITGIDYDPATGIVIDKFTNRLYPKIVANNPKWTSIMGKPATIVNIDTILQAKADKTNTYTKIEIDIVLALKANKMTTYTKSEVDAALALLSSVSAFTTGDVKHTFNPLNPAGWLFADGKTIGSVASMATGRANDDTINLYSLIWNNTVADRSVTAIYDSTGTPTIWGTSAADDFSANKRIQLPDLRGMTLIGADNMGGVARAKISGAWASKYMGYGGEESHTLAESEMPIHGHGVNDSGHNHGVDDPSHGHGAGDYGHLHGQNVSANSGGSSLRKDYAGDGDGLIYSQGINTDVSYANIYINASTTGISINSSQTGISIGDAGGGQPHNNIQPSMVCNILIKL